MYEFRTEQFLELYRPLTFSNLAEFNQATLSEPNGLGTKSQASKQIPQPTSGRVVHYFYYSIFIYLSIYLFLNDKETCTKLKKKKL